MSSKRSQPQAGKQALVQSVVWILTFSIIVGLFFMFQDDAGVQTLVLGGLLFWLGGTVIPLLASGSKGNPIKTMPLVGSSLSKAVGVALVAGAGFIVLSNAFLGSAVQLYSSTQMESVDFFIAVVFFGFVMVSVEESNWGKWMQPTLKHWMLEFRGMSATGALFVSLLFLVASFALVHFWFGQVVVSVVVGAIFLRTVISIVNEVTQSYLSGIIIHRMVQATALAVIFIEGLPLQAAFVAVMMVITLAPYYVVPRFLR